MTMRMLIARICGLTVLVAGAAPTAAQLPPMPPDEGATSEQPKLFVARRVLDLGEVLEGETVDVVWVIENLGNADLIIEKTKATCGCTVVQPSDQDRRIVPGGQWTLKAVFDSATRIGPQTKSVVVTSNDPTEPSLKLEFTANVTPLYLVKPSKVLNVRSVQRGQAITQTIDITPAPGRSVVEIASVEGPPTVAFRHEPFETKAGTGGRIHVTITDEVPLGRLKAVATIKLTVDGLPRERTISITGKVVGALTYDPRMIRTLDRPLPRGQKLKTVTVQSTNREPFSITGVTGGPWLDVVALPRVGRPERTAYAIETTIRDNAPEGPLAAMVEVMTDVLQQPIVRIPVFVQVAPPVEVDPPLILLKRDGTTVGMRRRVRLTARYTPILDIEGVRCDGGGIEASVDQSALDRSHIRYINVSLTETSPSVGQKLVVHVATSVEGAEDIEIPVVILAP